MSGSAHPSRTAKPSHRGRNVRSAQTVRKLLDAAVEALTAAPYGDLTVRSVAARAAVSPTTAYTYFPSKDALIAEAYLRMIREAKQFVDVNDTAELRVRSQLRELVLLVADTPHLANACTIALMAGDGVVDDIRMQIAREVGRRIDASLGPGASADVAAALHMMFSGAMMHARSTVGGYRAVADQLDRGVSILMSEGDAR